MSHPRSSSTGMNAGSLSLRFLVRQAMEAKLPQDSVDFLIEVYDVLGYIHARRLLDYLKQAQGKEVDNLISSQSVE